jgi:hypothetical protein
LRDDEQCLCLPTHYLLRDVESQTLRRITEIRAAIAGEITDADGVDAVRAALARLFERFEIRRRADRVHIELAWLGDGGLLIEPVVREQVIEGYTENLRPLLRREPLGQAENNYVNGLPTRYLFGRSPLARGSGGDGSYRRRSRPSAATERPSGGNLATEAETGLETGWAQRRRK